MRSQPQLLMCDPRHFEVRYCINPWMQAGLGQVDPARARRQWQALHRALSRYAEVSLMPAAPGLADQVFTANAALIHGRRAVPARFRHPERQPEQPLLERWLRSAGFELQPPPAGLCFEGAGDALFECGAPRLWLGAMRSDARIAPWLADTLGVHVESLRLIDPRFYHLDTCFCPLPRGGLLWFPPAFDEESRLRIAAAFPAERRVAVVESEATRFACNVVCLDDTVFGDGIGDATEARLAHLGLDVVRVQLDEFQKSGGSARCLTLRLDVPTGAGPVATRRQGRVASQSSAPSAARTPLAKQAVSR
jgi:N-dimethylarginine dimethylaminohydrolase